MSAVHHISADGPLLSSGADALGVIYGEEVDGAEWIAVPVARLDPEFFTLSSGIAGEFVQKFVNYKQRLAVVGDISDRLEQSDALRDFVRESNRGRHALVRRGRGGPRAPLVGVGFGACSRPLDAPAGIRQHGCRAEAPTSC